MAPWLLLGVDGSLAAGVVLEEAVLASDSAAKKAILAMLRVRGDAHQHEPLPRIEQSGSASVAGASDVSRTHCA